MDIVVHGSTYVGLTGKLTVHLMTAFLGVLNFESCKLVLGSGIVPYQCGHPGYNSVTKHLSSVC